MGTRKKILFIAHWYPNSTDTHKGIFIRNHALSLNAVSDLTVLDFSISYSSDFYSKKIFREKDHQGLDVLHIHVRSKFYKLLYYWIFFQTCILKKAFKQEKILLQQYDFIQTNVLFPSGIVGYRLARKFKKPLIHIEHWSYLSTFLKSDFHRKEGAKVLNYATKVAVVSEVLKESMLDFCESSKIEIIPNVVDSHFEYLPKTTNPDLKVFLAVANWRKPKNPFVFIEALEELSISGTFPKFKLILIGEGEQLIELKKRNLSFTIDFIGKVENSDLTSYYQQADFFLHGSDYETFSIVSIEALLTGTPVIASRVGVLPEVINDSNGVLCQNESASWVNGIRKAIESNYDNQLIANGIKNKFTVESVSRDFAKLLNDL